MELYLARIFRTHKRASILGRMAAINRINVAIAAMPSRSSGRGAQQRTRSPNYTTSFADLPLVRGRNELLGGLRFEADCVVRPGQIEFGAGLVREEYKKESAQNYGHK